MFRALVWKEWRQLGLLRWGGIALGAVLPLAFMAGAHLAAQGLLPTGTVKEYSSRDLMYEVLPAGFALGLWPLIALLVASQAFGGDRAAGTENFLLERPVARGAIWRARLAASAGSIVVAIVATTAIGIMFALMSGAPPKLGWTRWLILGGLGLGLALLAWIGAMLAATLLPSPLGAVLLGGVVGGVPALLAAQLTTAFPHARYAGIPLGMVLPWILVPGFVAASFFAMSRGEPAGRGRVKRGAGIAVGVLAAVIVLFLASAPIVVRASARAGTHGVGASERGGTALVLGGGEFASTGGWLVDVRSCDRLRFFTPPVHETAWKQDGSELAVLTSGGPFGLQRGFGRLEFFRASGEVARAPVLMTAPAFVGDLAWSGEDLVGVAYGNDDHRGDIGVVVLRSGAQAWTQTGFWREGGAVRVMGRLEDGRSAVLVLDFGARSATGAHEYRGASIFALDAKRGMVEGPILELPQTESTYDRGLSPDGRFLLSAERVTDDAAPGDAPRRRFVREIATGRVLSGVEPGAGAVWLSGDRLAWIASRPGGRDLVVATVEGQTRTARTWPLADIGLSVSPDGHALFISVLPGDPKRSGEATSAPVPIAPAEELVFLVDDERFLSLGAPFSDRGNDRKYTLWAGPRTLARIAPGVVAFEDLDAPGKRRFVLGSESDLR